MVATSKWSIWENDLSLHIVWLLWLFAGFTVISAQVFYLVVSCKYLQLYLIKVGQIDAKCFFLLLYTTYWMHCWRPADLHWLDCRTGASLKVLRIRPWSLLDLYFTVKWKTSDNEVLWLGTDFFGLEPTPPVNSLPIQFPGNLCCIQFLPGFCTCGRGRYQA